MQITAGTVNTYTDHDSQAVLQAVPWSVTDETGAVVHEGVQAFPLTASVEEIKDFLQQTLDVYKQDAERYEATKELQENLDAANATASEVSGITINDQ